MAALLIVVNLLLQPHWKLTVQLNRKETRVCENEKRDIAN